MLDETARTSGTQQVAQHIEHMIVGMQTVAFVEDEVEGIHGDIAFHGHTAFFRLLRFDGKIAGLYIPSRYRSEPFLRQGYGIFERDVSCYGENRIVRCIETEEEILHFVQCGILDVCRFLANGRPLVRMGFINKASHQVSHITVWLVQVSLLELLHHHMTLYFQAPFVEIERKHAVAFQPESRLNVLSG